MKTSTHGDLMQVPGPFHRECAALRSAGVNDWQQLADLPGKQLRALAGGGGASEARLVRLRAQARLMVAAGLPPEHASLLLHAGVAEVEDLALADPQRLLVQVNRLRLRLLGPGTPPLPQATVLGWIRAAGAGRSGN